MKKFIQLFIVVIFLLPAVSWGQTNPGFETGDLTGWTKVNGLASGTETVVSSNIRTSNYSMAVTTTSFGTPTRMENSKTVSIPNGNYLYLIVWTKGNDASNAQIALQYKTSTSYTGSYSAPGTSYTRMTTSKSINSTGSTQTAYIALATRSLDNTSSVTTIFDDFVAYVSTVTPIDLIAPNAPSAVSTYSNSDGTSITITWTDGTDAATCSQKALVLRANGTAQTPQTLNDQAQYTTGDVIGLWTVKGIVDVGTQTYSDNSTAANSEYTYAVYMSDLAYNYSTGTSSSATALPVELTSFTSNVIGNKVELNWRTATEVNNYGFELERLAVSNQQLAKSQGLNANSWVKIGFVEGNGNSNSPKSYSFTDEPKGGKEFNYRLKQIDNDGTYEYSDIVTTVLENISTFALEQNYPNPFNPTTMISYTIPERVNVKLKIYDMIAQQVAELVNSSQEAGHYQVTFDGSDLPSGVYFYKLEAGNFVEVKKFMLVK